MRSAATKWIKRNAGLVRKALPLVLAALLAPLSYWLVSEVGPAQRLYGDTEDWMLGLRPPIEASPRLGLVALETETADGRSAREKIAAALGRLRAAGAAVVIADFIFSLNDPKGDQALIAELRQAGTTQVVLVAPPVDGEQPEAPEPAAFRSMAKYLVSSRVRVGTAEAFYPADFANGVVLKRLDSNQAGKPLYHVALLGVGGLIGEDAGSFRESRSRLELGPLAWPVGMNTQISVLWPKDWGAFLRLRGSEVEKMPLDQLRSRVAGKLLVLGNDGSEEQMADMVDISVNGKEQSVAGCRFLLAAANSLLSPRGQVESQVSMPVLLALAFALTAGTSALALLGRGWRTVVLPVGLAGAFFGAVVLVARQTGFVIDPIVPLLGCALACGLTWTGKGATASLWKQSEGALTEAAILFCDIEDSTGLTRRLGPEGYQALYAKFIATSDSVVRRNDGELERTTGDGFVAVFRPHRHHPVDRAAKAAEEILTATATLAKSSLGMEFGRVSGAYVSEGGREVWSSAGETVNLAKRLQTLAGERRQRLLVGPVAARLLRERSRLRPLGSVALKGFVEEILVYTYGGDSE